MPTYPIDLPSTPKPKSIRYRQHAINSMSRNPFSGATQVYTWGTGWWEAEVLLPPMRKANAAWWSSALTSLNGLQGTFYLSDPIPRQGVGGGAAVVYAPPPPGYVNGGNVLLTAGWAANVPSPFWYGDWLTIANLPGLYRVVGGWGTTNSNGIVGIEIWPPLRGVAYDGWAITYTNPKGVFRLAANDYDWLWDEGQLMMGLSFHGIEAI